MKHLLSAEEIDSLSEEIDSLSDEVANNNQDIIDKTKKLIDQYNTLDEQSKKDKYSFKEYINKHTIHYYPIDNKNALFNRICEYLKKANKDGLLTLESAMSIETNDFVRKYYTMAIDGYEPQIIQTMIETQRIWLLKSYKYLFNQNNTHEYMAKLEKEKLEISEAIKDIDITNKDTINSLKAINKRVTTLSYELENRPPYSIDDYVESLKLELAIIKKGIMSTQRGDSVEDFLETLKDRSDNTTLDLDINYSKNRTKNEAILKFEEMLDKFNNDLSDLKLTLTIEDSEELISRIVEYSSKARINGVNSLYEYTITEKNSFLRETLQKIVFGIYSKSTTESINELLDKASGHSEDFLFRYERELTTIALGIKTMLDGQSPRIVEKLLFSLYAEVMPSTR